MAIYRKWTNEQLINAVKTSRSYRAVLIQLGLKPAGGNYEGIRSHVDKLGLNTEHFTGKGWNIGLKFKPRHPPPLEQVLVVGGQVQSFKLKKRLIQIGLLQPKCQLCGWAERSLDGRIPVELDHINGNHKDNRVDNLRILCPNCHSLQLTHRGLNKNRSKEIQK